MNAATIATVAAFGLISSASAICAALTDGGVQKIMIGLALASAGAGMWWLLSSGVGGKW